MSSEDLPLTVDSLLLFSCLEAGTTIGDILIWDGTHWVSTPAGNNTGNIVGPIATSSTNTALTRWNGTGGRTIQDSTVTLTNGGVFSSLITSTYVDSATNYRLSGATLLTQLSTNLICGLNVMPSLTSGTNNTGTGADVLSSLTTGAGNTVVGSQAVISNLIGDYNTVVGAQALRLGTASNNTAMGYRALYNVSTGGSNTSLGHTAGNDITTGSNNIILGVGTSAGSASAANRIVLGVGGSGVANNALTVHGSTSITDFYFPALSTTTPIANVLYFDTATGRIQYGTTPAPTVVTDFLDNAFRVQNSVTPTKQLAFNCVNISSSTTRTFTIPNVNGILPTTPNTTSVATGELSYAITVTGTNNTAYGKTAGVLLSDGIGNTAYGSAALSSVTTAASNTAVGYQSLTLSTAAELTAMGFQALSANTSGIQNTAMGTRALSTQSTATSNTAMGFQAGQAITFGSQNTIFGVNALLLTTTGSSNHAAGYQALTANTTGSYNIAIGDSALSSQQTVDANLAIGYQAMQSLTTATQCLAVGHQALKTNLIGTSNTAVGYGALRLSTSSGNTALGASVLYNNSTGTNNTSVGNLSLFLNTSGAGCTAMGQQTLYNNTIGLENSAFGYQAMINNLSGSQNSTLGMNSLGALTTGDYNTAMGVGAGGVLTTGSNNIMLGALSRAQAVGDSDCIVLGYNTIGNGSNTFTVSTNCVPAATTSYILYYNTANGSITYGSSSGGGGGTTFLDGVFRVQNTATPTKQLAFDCVNISSSTTRTFVVPDASGILPALVEIGSLCTGISSYTFSGTDNTIYGTNIGAAITTGYSNTLVGGSAGSSITTGYRNTFIGYAAGTATTDRNNNILLGASTSSSYNNSIVIGNSGAAIADNSLTIANVDTPITGFYFPGLATATTANVLYYDSATGLITYGAGAGGSSVFLDNAFLIRNSATPSKQLAFSCVNISSSTTITITAPDSNGILPAVPIASCLATGATSYSISGVDNTYYGILSGTATTTGFSNTAVGKSTLLNLIGGSRNTAVGSQALLTSISSTDCTALGYNALTLATGNSNTALGSGAGSAVAGGSSNILIGVDSGTTLTSGSGNIIIGSSSNVDNSARTSVLVLGASTTSIAANNSTTIGTSYVRNTSSSNILYYNSTTGEVSYGAAATGGTTFLDNVFRIQNSLNSTKQLAFDCFNISNSTIRTVTVPNANTILTTYNPGTSTNSIIAGNVTFISTPAGSGQTGFGVGALQSIQNGSFANTAMGFQAMQAATTDTSATAVGNYALSSASGTNSTVAIGSESMRYVGSSVGNTAVGDNSLRVSSLDYNTSIGASSLYNLTSGSYNIAVGYRAGLNYTGSESNNILLGNQGTPGDNAVIRIGTNGTQTACFIAGSTTVNGISCTSETISSSTALSTTLDSIIDASTSTLSCTLAAGNTDQCKIVRLLNRRSNTITVSCVAAGGGTFQLTPSEPSRMLRYNTTLSRWQIENGFSATAPDSFYPTTQQGSKIIGTGITGSGQFGFACALSSNGNTMAVGGQFDNTGVGAVWVFTRVGSTWTQQGAKFTGTGITGAARFGQAVAISSDGNTLAVGGYADNTNQGAVWVFTRSGDVWTQQSTKLTASGNTGISVFGYSLSLSADGNTMAIGGYSDNTNVGAVWIFTRSGSVWTQQGSKLVATGITGTGQFGYSVSISANGNTFASGAYNDNASIGAVWVFTRSGTTWTQQNTTKLIGSDMTSFARFGSSVSLSSDANTLAIGGFADNTNIGAVWVFTRNNGIWSQQTGNKLTGIGETGTGQFGSTISLSADGNTLVTGASNDNAGIGAIWVFTRSGGIWSSQGSKMTGTGETGTGQFGNTVSLSADGAALAVGGYNDNAGIGATWVFI
jgi:hypothetical protein